MYLIEVEAQSSAGAGNTGGINHREVFDLINSNAMAVLVAALLSGTFLFQVSKKIIKMWLESDLLRKEIPDAVSTINESIPPAVDKLSRIHDRVEEIHTNIEELRRDIREISR